MRASERSRLQFVESQAKRYKWRSVALVGVCDTGLARQFLAHFPRCKVFVVPVWREDLRPGPAGAQRHFQRNLKIWAKSYGGRFEVDEGDPLTVAARFGPQFDGVVLWDGLPAQLIAAVGAAWTPRVVSGGWILGLDHRQGYTREILDQVAPGWVHYREGIWGVRVRRQAAAAQVDVVAIPAVDHKANEPEHGEVGPVLSQEIVLQAGLQVGLSDVRIKRGPVGRVVGDEPSSALGGDSVAGGGLRPDPAATIEVVPLAHDGGPIKPPVGEAVAQPPVRSYAYPDPGPTADARPPYRRGRKPGSKNKPKVVPA